MPSQVPGSRNRKGESLGGTSTIFLQNCGWLVVVEGGRRIRYGVELDSRAGAK